VACAVTADEADALTFFNLQVDAIKDGRTAEGDVDVEEGKESHLREPKD